jgi:hypothetical protein
MQPKYLFHGALELWIAGFGWVFTQRLVSCLLGFQNSFAISNSLRVFEKPTTASVKPKVPEAFLATFKKYFASLQRNNVQIKCFNVPARKTD